MENKANLPTLRSAYPNMTKAEKRIADYIMENPSLLMDQTISSLATNTRSSEITISRFCKKLGCSGLHGLKIQLSAELYQADENIYHDISKEDSCEVLTRKLFQNIADALQDTIKILDYKQVEQAVDTLLAAKRVAVYGFGNSYTVCHDIETRFLRFGIPVQAYADSHLQVTSASLLKPGDVVIAVSHTGASIDLLKSVETAKNNGAVIIAITSYASSRLAGLADILLHGMGREVHYRSEAVASRLIHMAIADVLYSAIAIRMGDSYSENIYRMRKVIAQKRT